VTERPDPAPRFRAAHVPGSCADGGPCRYVVVDGLTGRRAGDERATLAEADEAAWALNNAVKSPPQGRASAP
jgi:hypothetical protein